MHKTDAALAVMILFLGLGVMFSLLFFMFFPLIETALILASILCFFLAVVVHGCRVLGYRDFSMFLVFAYGIPLLYEYTDACGFGAMVNCISHYSEVLGPKFLGKTPYIIPLAWAMFMYCALMMTVIIFAPIRRKSRSVNTRGSRKLFTTLEKGLVIGVIMVSLDLVIDPVMVAMGVWGWSYHGSYYGIPLWNYEGWIEIPFVTFLSFSLYLVLFKRKTSVESLEKPPQYAVVVVGIYVLSLILYSMYAFRCNMVAVVPWGLIAVGSVSTVTLLELRRLENRVIT